jgi:hypothetical protein
VLVVILLKKIVIVIGVIMNSEEIYPLAFNLSYSSRMEVVKWFISWQLNNPDNKVIVSNY